MKTRRITSLLTMIAATAVYVAQISSPDFPSFAVQSQPSVLFVSPLGSDKNTGTLASAPLKTIQAALNRAVPGTTIRLGVGVYREQPTTMRNGTASAPITIQGPESGRSASERYKAVLYGRGRIFNINNSFYKLDGFTIDGQEALAGRTYPKSLADVRAFKDSVRGLAIDGRLIYIGSATSAVNVAGVVIHNMFLSGGGGECVRLRQGANHNTIDSSVIQWCGMYAQPADPEKYRYHNGEGVYIGTSPKAAGLPADTYDNSGYNTVRNNLIVTDGSECLDLKEGSHDNAFIGNDCRNNDEPLSFDGSNLEIRGYDNIITDNSISGSHGSGLKIKSDSSLNPQGGNIVQRNAFSNSVGPAIINGQNRPQGLFCGNRFAVGAPIYTVPGQEPANAPCPAVS